MNISIKIQIITRIKIWIKDTFSLLYYYMKKGITSGKQTGQKDFVFFHIKPFKNNEFWVEHRETILKNISSMYKKSITFAMTWNYSDIKLYAKIPISLKSYFQNTFFANYPNSDLLEIENPNTFEFIEISEKPQHAIAEYIHFKENSLMRSQPNFVKGRKYMDPMKDVISVYNEVQKNSVLTIFFVYKFKRKNSIRAKIKNILSSISKWSKSHAELSPEEKQLLGDKSKKEIYLAISYQVKTPDQVISKMIKKNIATVFGVFCHDNEVKLKSFPKLKDMNINQAVNFFHIPTQDHVFKWLNYTVYRKLPHPTTIHSLPNKDLTILWTTDYRGEEKEFWITKEDKFRHMYIVGKTGTWKSTLISNMIKSDMQAENGLCLIDPHWDLVDTVLEHIPSHRINDIILFDIADTEYPIWFNLLQYETEDEKNRIVSGVVATFYRLFQHSRWPRLEYILRNVLLSVIEYPNATLMHILRILVDKTFRTEVLSHVKDDVVLRFRNSEFNKRNDRQREEAISPITNKIWQFLSSSIVRNIFWQPKTKLNLRKSMDEWKIILINLSKWKIGEDNASMIWSLLVTKFQIDVMSRADIPFEQRKDFYLYIDEFQNFATQSFSTILSEARKYKLSLIVANQYTSQLSDEVKDAIFWNVGTIISFSLWYDDAKIMSNQFKELASTNDLIALPRFHAYIKLVVDGIITDPFSMKTQPLLSVCGSTELIEKIKKQSRQRYSMPRSELEKLLAVRNKKTFSLSEKTSEIAKAEWISHWPNITDVFSTKDIKLWNWYDWYIKLKYNYGIFVSVKWVEWLLHKKLIVPPKWVERKKYYNIGDKIHVKAIDFKEVNWEQKVVRTQ